MGEEGRREGGRKGQEVAERLCECIYLLGCHSGREIFDVNSISIWRVETQLRLEVKPRVVHGTSKVDHGWKFKHRHHIAKKCAVSRLGPYISENWCNNMKYVSFTRWRYYCGRPCPCRNRFVDSSSLPRTENDFFDMTV